MPHEEDKPPRPDPVCNDGRRSSSRGGAKYYMLRLALALALPFVALALQLGLWDFIRPYVWFLFFPAVFFSSRIGRLIGGLAATVISALIVVYFFIPPAFSFRIESPVTAVSIAVFVAMGILFSVSHEQLYRANKRADEALASANTANDELLTANGNILHLYQRTRELDELKSQFFANVSHELRTPLELILGPVQKVLTTAVLTDPQRRDLEVIQRNARLLNRHVDDLLDVARLQAGRMKAEYADFDLAGLARFAASHFESLAAERQTVFSLEVPDELRIQADDRKCLRILFNLLSNAFKFTEEGGKIVVGLDPWATKRSCASRTTVQVCPNPCARPYLSSSSSLMAVRSAG